ncbi:MAG: glycosyltransferase family 2 protein, partial [Peptostreptococcaceae bacterium]
MKISIVIPTKNAENYIKNLIESLNNQTIKPYEIIVMDSNSIDNTKSICMQFKNAKVFQVIDFNHGKTRNDGAKIATGDIIVFMTQDAIPKDNYLIENLVKPLNNDIVGSYARQVANKNSDSIEKFSRQFNYPDFDIIKNNNRISELGI